MTRVLLLAALAAAGLAFAAPASADCANIKIGSACVTEGPLLVCAQAGGTSWTTSRLCI